MSAVLESLIEVGKRERIDEALHYGAKPQHMALHLGKTGKVLKVVHQEERPVRVPWPFNRTSNVRPNLLADSAAYLRDKKGRKWAASAELHRQWYERAPDHPAAEAVKSFFAKGVPELDIPTKHKSLDLILYFDGKPVCEYPEFYESIRDTLRAHYTYTEYPSRFDDSDTCILDMHGKVSLRGLENPQALIGFNQNVTWNALHNKNERMLHAPLSYEAMRNYVGGLTWLAQHRSLPTVGVKKGSSILWLGWAQQHHRIEAVVDAIMRGPEKDTTLEEHRAWAQKHLDSDAALFDDDTPYHLLVLGCDNRIAVRGFHTMTVGTLARRLVAFLDDFTYERDGSACRTMAPLYRILKMGEPSRPPTTTLVEAAGNALFLGSPYPRELETVALDAYIESSQGDEYGRPSPIAEAVLKAVAHRSQDTHDMTQVHETILTHPFFIAGRIFSVLETINWSAKDRGDSVRVTRALSRAIANPGRVILENLWATMSYHQEKLRKKGGRRLYIQEVSDLMSQMEDSLATRGLTEWPARGRGHDKQCFVRGRMYQEKLTRDARAKAALAAETTKDSEKEDIPDEAGV